MKRQSGMTLIGMLLVAFVGMFFLLLGLKLYPPYINNFKVKSDLASLAAEPGAYNMDVLQVTDSLDRRFEIDSVSRVHLSRDLTVTDQGLGKEVRIVYEERVPLIYNISVVISFDDHVLLVRGAGTN